MSKYYMTEAEVVERGKQALYPYLETRRGAKLVVHGIPRGGSCALLYLITHGLPLRPVTMPDQAEVILDDIIDSGATQKRHEASGKPFLALVNKRPEMLDAGIGWVIFPWESETGPEDAVVRLLEGIGEDPKREGLVETPRRVRRALTEMTEGYGQDPAAILSKTFDEPYDEIIVLKAIPFTSLCEHHLLVFEGTVDIGYLPGKVVGLSKLARLVDCFSRRLQIQERLTRQLAESIVQHLEARGVGVVVRAIHSCLSCRGIRKSGSTMVTSAMLGVFRDKPECRAEFLALCRD